MTPKGDNDHNSLSRRQALQKLAKCSAYTAPTVVTLLASSSSYAIGSGVNGATCGNKTNRNPSNPMYLNAADVGGNGNMNTPDFAADCGNNVSMNFAND